MPTPIILILVVVGCAALFLITRRPKRSDDFESRMRDSSETRPTTSAPRPTSSGRVVTPRPAAPSRTASRGAALGAGAIGGAMLGSEVARRREEERRRSDDEDAARRRRNDDSSYTPASTYTPPSSPASSWSSFSTR